MSADNPGYVPPDPVIQGIAEAPLPNPGGSSYVIPPDQSGGILGGGMLSSVGSLLSSGINLYSAAQNRKWQERMSNTAHQREVRDLRAAGLNPILSATRMGGSSTPSGSTANTDNPFAGIGTATFSAAQNNLTRLQLGAQLEATAYQNATSRQAAHSVYLDNMLKQQELLRSSIVTEQQKADADLTKGQLDQINAQKAEAEQMKPVFEALGPIGTAILKYLPMIIHGSGQVLGPHSAGAARRGSRLSDMPQAERLDAWGIPRSYRGSVPHISEK